MPDDLPAAGTSPFPVSRSLLSPAALAETVAADYGLDEPRCRLIKSTIRDVYRVDARQGPSVLIVYRHGQRMAAEIAAELDLLAYLAQYGPARDVRVAPGLPTLAGRRLLALPAPEGPRSAVLFQFVEGAPLGEPPEPEDARRLGRLVAQVHLLTDAWPDSARCMRARPPLGAARLLDRPLAQAERLLAERPADLADLRRAAGLLRRRLAALPTEPPGYGLVHGDLIPSNILVGPDGGLTLLDFDFCGLGWRTFDVATYLWDAQARQAPEGTGRSFLAGYQEVRSLADWELGALPLFAAVRGIFRLGNWHWRVEEWGTSALLDRLLAGIKSDLARVC